MAGYLMDFGFGGFIGYGWGARRIGDGRAEYKCEVLLGRKALRRGAGLGDYLNG